MPAILPPASRAAPPHPLRDRTVANIAVVRGWWLALENEWQAALSQREPGAPDSRTARRAEPRLLDALAGFEDFAARIEDLLAREDMVILAIAMCGRVAGCQVSAREAWVCRVAEDAVVEVRDHPSVERAIAAVAESRDGAQRDS